MSFQAISTEYPLILASASHKRERLLQQIGLPFRSLPSNIEEDRVMGDPFAMVRLLSEKKARAVLSKYKIASQFYIQNNWILGADTVVVLGETILGKPKDHNEAGSMLLLLSGKGHKVITGFSILDPLGRPAHSEEITTLVQVKCLTDEEIRVYIATGEPFGKAGSYAIQGIGSFMIESISGSYTNVVGLPVCALIKSLLATGALKSFP